MLARPQKCEYLPYKLGAMTMNETIEIIEAEEYLYVVHGVIPEAMPPVAYRRSGSPDLAGRKLLKCPYCHALLTDVAFDAQIQMYKISKGKQKKAIPGLFIKRCNTCRKETGIIMSA
jgi:hypothetical protein